MEMGLSLLKVTQEELHTYLTDSSLLAKRLNAVYGEEDRDRLIDLDKAWNGVLYVLTGNNFDQLDHPLAKAIFSKRLIDPQQDLGNGPAHFVTAEEVKEVSEALNNLTKDDLNIRFDPHRMSQLNVYPDIWDEGETSFEYIWHAFVTLKHFYDKAANHNHAIISFLN